MVAPGAGFRGGTHFRTKNRSRPKKDLRGKMSGFSVQKYVKTKKKKRSLPKNQKVCSPNEDGDD